MKISIANINPIGLSESAISISTTAVVEAFRYHNVRVVTADQVDELSIFGTPVFMSLTFDAFSWRQTDIVDGQRKTTIYKVPQLHVPAAICTVSFQKTIIETFVQRQTFAGSFNEHINFGNYAISIKGILCNDNSKYPLDLVNYLNQICRAPVAIEITHTILNKLGIYSMIIRGGTPIADADNKQNIQPFTLECTSDSTRSLIINTAT